MRTTGNGSRRGLGDSLRPSMPREPMKSKVVLLGDGGVGKTSLVRRFVVDQYSDDYITTVGTKVSKKSVNVGSALDEVEMIMAANKSDLAEDRVWAEEYLYFFSQKYTCPGILTSAKTGDKVELAFKALGDQILRAAHHPVKHIDLVTPPQEPVDRLIRVTDKIMTDFCYRMGGVETGMPIVKRQLGLAGLDVRAPTAEAIRTLINRLATVEQDFKGPEEIEANRDRRLGWLDGPDL